MMKAHREEANPAPDAKASAEPETDAQKIERLTKQQNELQGQLAASSAKIEALETRLGSLNDKVDASRSTVDNLIASQRTSPKPVGPKSTDLRGTSVNAPMASSDPEAGFVSDESIQRFRKAMVLFNSKNYSDSVLAFSAFIDQYPDHALAGSAQFYLAESYYHQGEYRLAQREYQRVLTTYDRSPRVSDTLRRIADCEDRLQQPQAAAQHRELLMTLFPASPAAAEARNDRRAPPSAETPANAPTGSGEHAAPAGSTSTIDATPSTANTLGTPSEGSAAPSASNTSATAGSSGASAPAGATPPAETGLDSPPPTAPATSEGHEAPAAGAAAASGAAAGSAAGSTEGSPR